MIKKIIKKDILLKILWSTIEDFVGLWEINWELRVLLPANNNTQNKVIAKKIIEHFLENGLVTLYYSKWGDQEIENIPLVEAKYLLNQNKYWSAPAIGETCIKIGITDKGSLFYIEDKINDLLS